MPGNGLLLDPAEVASATPAGALLVDLSRPENHARFPVAGAVHLDYGQIVRSAHPAHGLLPDEVHLRALFGRLGITPDTHVIALDDEGGGNAARLLWTLACMGHQRWSLLDGGLAAWVNEGHPIAEQPGPPPAPVAYQGELTEAPIADAGFIQAHLDDWQLVDARSPAEYLGRSRSAMRSGHIPGALNCDWVELMDRNNNLRLLPRERLQQVFRDKGIDPAAPSITYCQTHHRSSLTWFVLRYLGNEQAKGYPGSWSDWGNRPDTPIET